MLHMRKHSKPNEQFKIPRGLKKTHAIGVLYNCNKQMDTIPAQTSERPMKKKPRMDSATLEMPLQVFDEDMIYQTKPDPEGTFKDRSKQKQNEPIEVTQYRLVKDNVERIVAINTKDLATEEPGADRFINWQRDYRNNPTQMEIHSSPPIKAIAQKVGPRNVEEPKVAMGKSQIPIEINIIKKSYMGESPKVEPKNINRFRNVMQKIHGNRTRDSPRVPPNGSGERFCMQGDNTEDKENIAPTTEFTRQFYFNEQFGKNRPQEPTEDNTEQEDSEQERADNAVMLARLTGGSDRSESDMPTDQFSKFTLSKLENITESNAEGEALSLQSFSSVKMLPSISDKSDTMKQSLRLTQKTSTSSTPSPQCKHLLSQRKAAAHKNRKYKNFICKLATQLNVARGAIKQMQHKLSKHFGDCTTLQGLLEQYRFQRNILSNLDKMETAIKAIQEKSQRVSLEIVEFRKTLQESNANLRATYFDNMKMYDSVRF